MLSDWYPTVVRKSPHYDWVVFECRGFGVCLRTTRFRQGTALAVPYPPYIPICYSVGTELALAGPTRLSRARLGCSSLG